MAQKWMLLEDYIVCEYCMEYENAYSNNEDLDCILLSLKGEGFDSRTKSAVQTRARYYEYLYRGWGLPYIPEQVIEVYRAFYNKSKNPEVYKAIDVYVKENLVYETSEEEKRALEERINCIQNNAALNDYLLHSNQSNIYNLITTDPIAPSFKEVLLDHIRKSGMTDAEVYRASRVSRDKFNHIINGRKGKSVKPSDNNRVNASQRTVMQLCIGLKLSYEDAVHLMACAGYAFQPNEEVDLVVAACLKQRICNIFDVNEELYERNLEIFEETRYRNKK